MIRDLSFLYVEDDPFSREGLDLVLRRVMGIPDVTIFENSLNFLDRVIALPRKPDVFLLDIHMKPYSGFEMLAMLRGDPHYARARIVALTASVMSEEVHVLKTSGFDGIISKPIDVASFPQLIERVINGEAVWTVSG